MTPRTSAFTIGGILNAFLLALLWLALTSWLHAESACVVWGLDVNESVSKTTEIYCLDDAGWYLTWPPNWIGQRAGAPKSAGGPFWANVTIADPVVVPAYGAFPSFTIPAGRQISGATLFLNGKPDFFPDKNTSDWIFLVNTDLNL
jgi:hypothetical protein